MPTMITLCRISSLRSAVPIFLPLTRAIHENRITQRPSNPTSQHSAENYFVDGDDTPPDTPIYHVDANSHAAQSAYETPSGPWSRAGAGTEEYRTVSDDEPYDVQNGSNMKQRYGGMKRYKEDKGPETSEAGEGPEGTERCGRKPEGRA